MRKRSLKEQQLFTDLQAEVRFCGLELIDLRCQTESGKRFLRLYIDKSAGVSIEDCERVSLHCDPILDARGEGEHDYFEVESAGLERNLETELDFTLHAGSLVQLSFYQKIEGQKTLQAVLQQVDHAYFYVEVEPGQTRQIERAAVANIKRVLQF